MNIISPSLSLTNHHFLYDTNKLKRLVLGFKKRAEKHSPVSLPLPVGAFSQNKKENN